MTRDDIIRMARDTGCLNVADYGHKSYEFQPEELERFANLVAAAEREACAKLMGEMAEKDKLSNYYRVAALVIRERGAP
jgi:hypothetical protein